jgi:hypothetical protein
MGASPITKGNLFPLPKRVFHVVRWGAPVRPVLPRTEPMALTSNLSNYESKIRSRCSWENPIQICVEKHEENKIRDWTCATGQTGEGRLTPNLGFSQCVQWNYGLCMSSRGSQEMIYQQKFKSLHKVNRLGKKKIWIPLERRTWIESKELEGESKEKPWEILLLPILRLSLGWIFKSP